MRKKRHLDVIDKKAGKQIYTGRKLHFNKHK